MKPWVRKLSPSMAPTLTLRWQSYIPGAPEQFQHHATQADALARIARWKMRNDLIAAVDSLKGVA